MRVQETSLRASVIVELEKVESSTARRLANILGLETQPNLVFAELHAMEKEGLIERGTKRGREPWYFLANKVSPAAQAAPQPAVGNTGSAVSGMTTTEGRAVAEVTPEPEAAFPSFTAEGSGGNVTTETEMPLLNVIADIRAAIGDSGKLMLGELAGEIAKIHAHGEKLEGVAHVLRGCGIPGLAQVSADDDLQMYASALAGAYQMALGELATERQARQALQEQINARADDPPVDVKDVARGYLVRVQKRRPRIVTKAETAVAAAMAAARNGSGRGDVFALVPIGSARRGAEWSPSK